MRENEQFITPDFTKKVDRWLRREDTWLAKGLRMARKAIQKLGLIGDNPVI